MDPQEWTGHWWLPGVPDQTVPGVLRFGPNDGLTLSLIGGFESRVLHRHGSGMVERIGESRTWPVIQGVAGNTDHPPGLHPCLFGVLQLWPCGRAANRAGEGTGWRPPQRR